MLVRQVLPFPITTSELRARALEAFELRKRAYRVRLNRVKEGVAFSNGRDIPNRDDRLEAQRMMDAEYMALFRQWDRDHAAIEKATR